MNDPTVFTYNDGTMDRKVDLLDLAKNIQEAVGVELDQLLAQMKEGGVSGGVAFMDFVSHFRKLLKIPKLETKDDGTTVGLSSLGVLGVVANFFVQSSGLKENTDLQQTLQQFTEPKSSN